MGSISDKLDYLIETKRLLRETLEKMGATVTDEDAFRSYVDKLEETAPDTTYITKYAKNEDDGVTEIETITDLIGEYNATSTFMLCPKIKYPELETKKTYFIPYTLRAGNYPYNTAIAYNSGGASYQRVEVPESVSVKFTLNMVKPGTLVLPEGVVLSQYTLINGASGTDSNSFTRGLCFGKRVDGCESTWISRTLTTTKRVVKFPEGFKMKSGVTLYLSKIYITQDCLKEMVERLYDYIGNGETTEVTRTISVGSTNKALLTSDEIDQAYNKGWKISV